MNWTEAREYPQIIGWPEAQELNARGWEIILSGRVRKNLREVIRIKPNTDELTFNETVREFIKNHYDNEFKAYKILTKKRGQDNGV